MSSLFFTIFIFLSLTPLSLSQPKGIFIDCGAEIDTTIDGIRWQADAPFVSSGTPRAVVGPVMLPTLAYARSFPNALGRKFCYVARAYRGAPYMVRTTYYYGGINGKRYPYPPVFDQAVDGTLWSVVNTTADYAAGECSYYEGVFRARGSSISVCVGANAYTESEPFISALELVILDDTVYNSTDFERFGLGLVERTSFGYGGPNLIRYPDDKFNRYWQPYGENNPTPATNRDINTSGFWNVPPLKIFETELTMARPEPLILKWPKTPLPETYYYIALYFAESNVSLSSNPRSFSILINNITYYRNMKLSRDGIAVFATRWPLSGQTTVSLIPSPDSSLGPLINGGEVFEVIPLGDRTITRDVIALEQFRESLQNYPPDWSGDPCFPRQYAWTGITCSEGPRIRIVSINLIGMGLYGTLSQAIANLTALNAILLGNNKLSGPIPDLSNLKILEKLHLDNNGFIGEIPQSLGTIDSLRELYLQNNHLTGYVPNNLIVKQGLDLRVFGNLIVTPPPPSR